MLIGRGMSRAFGIVGRSAAGLDEDEAAFEDATNLTGGALTGGLALNAGLASGLALNAGLVSAWALLTCDSLLSASCCLFLLLVDGAGDLDCRGVLAAWDESWFSSVPFLTQTGPRPGASAGKSSLCLPNPGVVGLELLLAGPRVGVACFSDQSSFSLGHWMLVSLLKRRVDAKIDAGKTPERRLCK